MGWMRVPQPAVRFALFCLFLTAAPALAADVLKIETETTLKMSGDRLMARVVFANRGTATAFNLQVHLTALGRTDSSPVVAELPPGGSEKALFERDIKGTGRGRYPLTVRVDFHDANQYPFSALSGMTFAVGDVVNPDLAALGRDTAFDRSGTLRFDLKNLGPPRQKVSATLILPKEFSSPQTTTTFDMDQRSDRSVAFEVRNFSALPGASYPVFCYVEYDGDGVHHTVLARATMTVTPDETLFRRYPWAWLGLSGVLAVLLIIFLIQERRRRRQPPTS